MIGEAHAHPAECPACGHDLSHFNPTAPDRAELFAGRVANAVASWKFAGVIAASALAWLLFNIIVKPEPYPVLLLAGTSAALSVLAAAYGPLILLTQRRAAERDRMAELETLRVSANNEADLHRLIQLSEEIKQLLTSEDH